MGELVDVGLLVREDDGSFVAPSRGLLDLTVRMLDAGVSIDIAVARRRAAAPPARRKAADDLVELFESETGRSFAGKGRPEEVAAALDVLRPIALDNGTRLLACSAPRGFSSSSSRAELVRARRAAPGRASAADGQSPAQPRLRLTARCQVSMSVPTIVGSSVE